MIETLAEAKQHCRDNWEVGIDCPCCGQLVRKWRHSINSSLARTMIKMEKISTSTGDDWVHIGKQIGLTTMYGILTYWDLIEPLEHSHIDDLLDGKKSSGKWRLTQKGRDFVNMRITLQKYAYAYDHKRVGFDGEQISIAHSLGKKFNYSELMRG